METPPPAFQLPPSQPPPRPGIPRALIAVLVLAGVAVLAIFAAAFVGGYRKATSTDMLVNGRPVGRGEAKESLNEMKEMLENAKAGDPSTINTNVQPKTELGKAMLDLVRDSQAVEKEYEKKLADIKYDEMLSAKNLGTPTLLKQSANTHTEAKKASANYFTKSRDLYGRLAKTIGSSDATAAGKFKVMGDELSEMEKLSDAVMETSGKLLAFVQKAKPSYAAAGDQLMFKTDAQIETYDNFIQELTDRSTKLTTRMNAIIARRQASMRQGFASLPK